MTAARQALAVTTDTAAVHVGDGVNAMLPDVLRQHFPGRRAIVVADTNTFAAAGEAVAAGLRARGLLADALVLEADGLWAEYRLLEPIEGALRATGATPVAVGAGCLNDLVKLASHHRGERYVCVATSASMDGYTAYGASITRDGSKQTFDCPAARCVLADLGVICNAPAWLNGAGYADLLAKVPAGADWIVADALGIEPIEPKVWDAVQGTLREALADPAGVRRGEAKPVAQLVHGLIMSGFAMQLHRTSRPASGAEHQFSHLWDMQGHTHDARHVAHGHQVGIGSWASIRLYEELLADDLGSLDVEGITAAWPGREELAAMAERAFDEPALRAKAGKELAAKWTPAKEAAGRLRLLRERWPGLRERLRAQLIASERLRELLTEAGCPATPGEIGIDRERLRHSYAQAWMIRRRFTVLDLAKLVGRFDRYVSAIVEGC